MGIRARALLPFLVVQAALCFAAVAGAETRTLRPEDIFALKEVGDPHLSPDGAWVAYTVGTMDPKADESDTDVYMVPLSGGDAIRVTTSPKPETSPRFSPDGRYLAFLSGRDGKKAQVWLLDRRGGEAVKLTAYKGGVSSFAWSPDSTRLALVAPDPDPDAPDEDDDKPAAEKKKTPKPIVIRRLQFKRDGQGYLRELRNHIHVFDVKGRTSVQVTSGAYDDGAPAWSPDSQWIAFSSNRTTDPDANRNSDIFVVAPRAGAPPRAVAAGPRSASSPVFSPDGRTIAFVSGGDPQDLWYSTNRLAVVPAGGGEEAPLTATLDRNVSGPRFSPDGKWIYFQLEDGGNRHLARVTAAGGPVERVVSGERDVDAFDLGPKGEIVVLESQVDHPGEVSAVGPAGALRRLSRVNDEFLKGIRLGRVERFKAESADGTMIDGFLTYPPDAPPGRKLPAVLRIHGGPVSQFSTRFSFEWQILAANGYAVIAGNPRGSSGYGLAFSRAIWADWGNRDFQDVMALVDHVVGMGVADPDRLGVGGWSYGGILTDYVVTKSGRFKAAISGASEANYLSNYGTDHYQYEWETELGLPWRNTERWVKMSPWFSVDKITTPTLLMGGADDMNVPLLNSEQLYQALRRLGVPSELVIYPGQNHGIRKPSYVKDRYERYVAWYDKYLKPGAAADASTTTPTH